MDPSPFYYCTCPSLTTDAHLRPWGFYFYPEFPVIYKRLELRGGQPYKSTQSSQNQEKVQNLKSQPGNEKIKEQLSCPQQNQRLKKSRNTKKIDEQYTPSIPLDQKSHKSLQNQKRNVMPNLINQILKFLISQKKSGYLVKKLIKLMEKNVTTIKRYYQFQKTIKKQINRYVNLKTFLKMLIPFQFVDQNTFQYQEQKMCCSIARRIIKHFLDNESTNVTIYSNKIKKQNQFFHLQAQRIISSSLKQIN